MELQSGVYNFLFEKISSLGFTNKVTHSINSVILLLALGLVLYVVDYLLRRVIRIFVIRLARKSKTRFDDYLIHNNVLRNIIHFIPLLIAQQALPQIFVGFPNWTNVTLKITDILVVLTFGLIVNGIFKSFRDVLKDNKAFADKPLDSYAQVISILIFSVCTIIIFSDITGKSPVNFLLSLGAASAILMLIFKDTILGFIASIQVSVNDMVRVGDWVAMPKYDADGYVLTINLTTVKVQNWDKTITTVPTYAFINDSFKNWRGMTESGGRQIRRTIYFKMSSFRFLTNEELEKFKKYRLIRQYIYDKENEIAQHNANLQDEGMIAVNTRRMTNIGVFRMYAENYIKENKNINTNMLTVVRQLSPTPKGLPLEIYCFSNKTQFIDYEKVAADIFDHLLTVAPEFGLEIFEEPSGGDFKQFIGIN